MWSTARIPAESWTASRPSATARRKFWDSRKDAADFFLQAIAGSEGCECERYTKIYAKLVQGLEVCSDDADD
jgi:hypothetical protein